jgi:hypothetical protein
VEQQVSRRPDLAARLASTGQLLVRSGIEIDRILSAMVDDHAAVSASLPQQSMFLSRLVGVDPVKQRLFLAYSDYKEANTALLAAKSVNLRCQHRSAQFAFACNRPRPASYGGQQVIKLDAPAMVLAVQHHKRVVPAQIAKAAPDLRCQLPMGGGVLLEARLIDMSLDGHAFLLGDPALPVCAGTWLRGARITPQGAEPVTADIEVKYVIPTVLPDGDRATRIGCRIVGADAVMEQIVRRFIIDFA